MFLLPSALAFWNTSNTNIFVWLTYHITFGLIHSIFAMCPRRNARGLITITSY
ncbi:hypothetical protein HanPSC8_Chr09g0352541 [Helianthus annuus]|nr:hypothetical protein HanPSC8_Chr09g0352541 [Helianthus annuus]